MRKSDIVILGGGESGVGAALLARRQGLEVFLSDRGTLKDHYREELRQNGIPFEEGGHTHERLFVAGEIVKSPGIPDQAPLIRELREAGLPVISEIEFAGRYTDADIIGITGSNGKTTTTRLIYHLLLTGGLDVAMGGNVGNSFARLLTETPRQYYVLELSSFQLDGIEAFHPRVAVLLNITPDHLDRYDYRLENYVASKFRIVRNQQPGDAFLYNAEDPNIRSYLENHPARAKALAVTSEPIRGEEIHDDDGAVYQLGRSVLRGRHNAMNALFAIRTAHGLGVTPPDIQRGLDTFVNAPHRLEYVAEVDGVLYLNDSKATNVDAAFFALEAMTRPVVWIVGGQDKGNDYEPLLPLVRQKVKAVVCLGADNSKIRQAFGSETPAFRETRSAAQAVQTAAALAAPGDVVLLSPACASFDLFKNYEDRGEQFKTEVKKLNNSIIQ